MGRARIVTTCRRDQCDSSRRQQFVKPVSKTFSNKRKGRLVVKGFQLIIAALVLLVSGVSAFAQTSKGFVAGSIVDPQGAAIGGATIKLTNTSTGISRETVSTLDGTFRVDAIDPGNYTIEVSQTGFKTVTRENVVVVAAQTTTAEFKLEVGAPSEVVTIT